MSTKEDRVTFAEAIKQQDSAKIRQILQRDDAKQLLLTKGQKGWFPIHDACCYMLDNASLQLILDAAVKHGIAKQMLEAKTNIGSMCLHLACDGKLPTDSFRLLLEYLSKHADIRKMLEKKNNQGLTCLHCACCNFRSSPSLLLLLISFFPSNESLQLVFASKITNNKTPLDEQVLQDPNCWRECRYWLFRNHQETFLNSLYPNSPEKTLEALKELKKNYTDDETLKKAIAQMEAKKNGWAATSSSSPDPQRSSSSSKAADPVTVEKAFTDSQMQVNQLSEEELDRQELEKFIFDRLSRDRCITQVIPILHENDVTKESFFLLKESDFRDMKIKIGPMRQLLQIIEQETFRRNNLSARSDISSRPRSPVRTSTILGVVPPIALSASVVSQQNHQQQQKPPDDVMSFAATEVSENGGSSKPQTNSVDESF